MNLYILRHAEAGEAPRDEDRELTARGREQAQAVAAGIAKLGLSVDAILTSPLPRARQTAQPVAETLGLHLLRDTIPLATGHSASEALSLLESNYQSVMFVGHEPQLSSIMQRITGGQVHMRKAALAHIEVQSTEPPLGQLSWLLTWQHLGLLARANHGEEHV